MNDTRELTDEQCDEFRRTVGSFNDMVRTIYAAGRASMAKVPEVLPIDSPTRDCIIQFETDCSAGKVVIYDDFWEELLSTLPKDDSPSHVHTRQISDNHMFVASVDPAVRPSDMRWPDSPGPTPAATIILAVEGTQAPKVFVLEDVPKDDTQATFQEQVGPWLLECFGEVIAADTQERNHRFLEESLELVQACGATASEAHQLVDYVYGRPVGEKAQEAGGAMVTLAALCRAQGIDMHECGEIELARISDPAIVEKIRAKQAAKPKHSPLPQADIGMDGQRPIAEIVAMADGSPRIVKEGTKP